MKRILLLCFSIFVLAASAQDNGTVSNDSTVPSLPIAIHPSVGYLSYDSALKAMPQYAIVQQQLADLRNAYRQEMNRVEEEFNQKYEAFLEGQRDFPRTILLKRQTELQQLMQHNIDFKNQSRRELQQAEVDSMKPLRVQLDQLLAVIARERGLWLVLNTDAHACPFIEPDVSVDLQEEVNQRLQNEK